MTEPRKIEIVISAQDDYSAALRKFNEAMGTSSGGAREFTASTNKLNQEIGKLGDINEYALSGLKKLKNIAEGFAFGAVIGGFSALTEMLVENYKASSLNADKLRELNDSIITQAEGWKILPSAIGGATAATVGYFNARVKLAQFEGALREDEVKAELEKYEIIKRNYEINLKAFPGRAEELGRKVEEYNVKIAALRVEQERLNWVMNLTPQTVDKVNTALTAVKDALTIPEGENSLTAFFAGELLAPAAQQKYELTGSILGAKFVDGFKTSAQTSLDNMGNLTFSMSKIKFSPSTDEVPLPEEYNFEDIALDRHLERLNSKYQAEKDYFAARLNITDENFSALNAVEDLYAARDNARQNIRLKANDALAQQYLNLIAIGKFSLGAFAQIVAQQVKVELTGLAARSTIWAVYETAMGLKDLAVGSPSAAAHFASAAEFGTVAGGAMVAAAGVQAAFGGGNERPAPGTTGGPPIITSSPGMSTSPSFLSQEAPRSQYITVNIQALDPSSVNWDRMMENNIKPALEKLSGDGNVALNIKVANG